MGLDKVTLLDFIHLNKSLKPINDKLQSLVTATEGISTIRADIAVLDLHIKRAVQTYNLFTESAADVKTVSVDSVLLWYEEFSKSFELALSGAWWKALGLCEPELTHMTPITFGQFIDAKMIVDAGNTESRDKWEILQYLMAIFMIGKRKYDYYYTNEDNAQFKRCGKKSLLHAAMFSYWWNTLNAYINSHYTVFQNSGDHREFTDNIDEHMKRWGWVNFLKTVAKTKAFDIAGSGMNSIDCVRDTKASEILVWASEEKDNAVASMRDMKEASKR